MDATYVPYLLTCGDNASWDLKISDKPLENPKSRELIEKDPNVNRKGRCNIEGTGVVVLEEKSEAIAVKSSNKILVKNSTVANSVEGGKLIALINAEAMSVLATNGDIYLDNSKLSGDVETDQIILFCEDSIVEGKLTCKNQRLEIVNSRISVIDMNSPTIKIKTEDLIAGLRECRDLGMIQLKPNTLIIGDNRDGRRDETTWKTEEFTFQTHQYPSSFNNNGSSFIGGDLQFSANNFQDMSSSIEQVLNEPQGLETKPLLTRQVITLRDTHVKSLNFAKPGGLVILQGTAIVESVSGGEVIQGN